jgi:hypothetical protein
MSNDQELVSLDERELELVTLDDAQLELVNGAWGWSDLKEAAKGGFGLRTLYREGVKTVTAAVGGWKLANQMYGSPEKGASWSDKWRAMGAFKGYLDGSEKLPSWAPQW